MPARQEVYRLQMRERRSANFALVWLIGSIRDEIDPEFALRRFYGGIDFAWGHAKALGVKLEMLDHGFHGSLHFGAPGRDDLVVVDGDSPLRIRQSKFFDASLHDPNRLAHLLHAHEVAIIAVAVSTNRDVEIKFGITFIGLSFPQVPGGAGAAHHHAGKPPCPSIRELHGADTDIALFEYAVFRQQFFKIVTDLEEGIAKRPDVVEQRWRQVLMHAADAEIIGMHARTGSALVKHHQFLAFFEAP